MNFERLDYTAKDCTNTPGLPSVPSIQELSIMNKIRRNNPFSKFHGNLKKKSYHDR